VESRSAWRVAADRPDCVSRHRRGFWVITPIDAHNKVFVCVHANLCTGECSMPPAHTSLLRGRRIVTQPPLIASLTLTRLLRTPGRGRYSACRPSRRRRFLRHEPNEAEYAWPKGQRCRSFCALCRTDVDVNSPASLNPAIYRYRGQRRVREPPGVSREPGGDYPLTTRSSCGVGSNRCARRRFHPQRCRCLMAPSCCAIEWRQTYQRSVPQAMTQRPFAGCSILRWTQPRPRRASIESPKRSDPARRRRS